jgi:hypothetical protein
VHTVLARFVAAGLVALVVVSLGSWWAARWAAEREAVEDARQRTVTLAAAVVEPSLTDGLLAGSPRALERFDRIVRERVLGDDVLRVKLWSADGTVVYSDQAELTGERYPLGQEEREVLRSGGVEAEESDLDKRENRLDQGSGPLLEVYLAVHAPDGTELLFETYQSRRLVADRRGELLMEFAPITLAGLGIMLGALVPVVWSLARSLEQARGERERLLRQAIEGAAPATPAAPERVRVVAGTHDEA